MKRLHGCRLHISSLPLPLSFADVPSSLGMILLVALLGIVTPPTESEAVQKAQFEPIRESLSDAIVALVVMHEIHLLCIGLLTNLELALRLKTVLQHRLNGNAPRADRLICMNTFSRFMPIAES